MTHQSHPPPRPGGIPLLQGLNLRQTRFAHEYLLDLNGTQAAIRAGYSAKTAAQIAERLLRKVGHLE